MIQETASSPVGVYTFIRSDILNSPRGVYKLINYN